MVIKQFKNETFFQNKYCHGKITCVDLVMEISMMQVEPEYRSQGYAKKFMVYIINYIKAVHPNTKQIVLSPLPLDTHGLNLKSLISFYKKFGFIDSNTHPQDMPYMMYKAL